MFEEAQLYAPVTRSGDDVTVHLGDDHPGAVDPEYRARRNALAALAMDWQPGTAPTNCDVHRGRAGGLAHRLRRAAQPPPAACMLGISGGQTATSTP